MLLGYFLGNEGLLEEGKAIIGRIKVPEGLALLRARRFSETKAYDREFLRAITSIIGSLTSGLLYYYKELIAY